ncbi:MAG: GntR family transcriptional regulator [Candidatus Dormibacteraceae bacterium]
MIERLRALILEFELPPGTRLLESELASSFAVSKTPIREALLVLSYEGLVKLAPYQGATVTWLTLGEYQELLFIQDALEQPALPLVARWLNENRHDVIRQLSTRLRSARKARDSKQFADTAVELHSRLFAVVGYSRLSSYIRGLIGGPGRRYQRVLHHQFDDAWDLETKVNIGRFEYLERGDTRGAARLVKQTHARLLQLARKRLTDPKTREYFQHGDEPRSALEGGL